MFTNLFGIANVTGDEQNSVIEAPLGQVFSSNLWPEVLANLSYNSTPTSPAGRIPGVSILHTVPVLGNEYLGVSSYELETLIIIGNELQPDFMNAFRDPAVKAHTTGAFPNKLPTTMSTFQANMLCVNAGWNVERLSGILKHALLY